MFLVEILEDKRKGKLLQLWNGLRIVRKHETK